MAGTTYLARTWTLVNSVCERGTCTFTASRRMTDEPVIELGMTYYIGTATEVPVLTVNDDGSETFTETKYEGAYKAIVFSESGSMQGLLVTGTLALMMALTF